MAINICNRSFLGPFRRIESIQDKPGVYVVLCEINNRVYVLDVDQSGKVKASITNHKRWSCWKRRSIGKVLFAVYYTRHDEMNEMSGMCSEITSRYRTPCNEKDN